MKTNQNEQLTSKENNYKEGEEVSMTMSSKQRKSIK
jgi:hypothetical protein